MSDVQRLDRLWAQLETKPPIYLDARDRAALAWLLVEARAAWGKL